MYKSLDDETRESCITLLRSAVALAQQANTLLEIAGNAVEGVLKELEAKDESESRQQ